jgi:enamine deaminase RidA (YjgF/YER057c/UK114 family)
MQETVAAQAIQATQEMQAQCHIIAYRSSQVVLIQSWLVVHQAVQ